jgi:hypothetical protein
MTLLERPEAKHVRRAVRAALKDSGVGLYRLAEDALVERLVELLLEDRATGGDIVLTWLAMHLAHLAPEDAARVRQAAVIVRERREVVQGAVETQHIDLVREG